MVSVCYAFAAALLLSLLLVPMVRTVARRTGHIATPRADRWHSKPTALLGGIGIYTAYMISYLVFHRPNGHGEGLLAVCASSMFVVGLIDDIVHMKPYAKLICQLVAATVLTAMGLQLPWTTSVIVNRAITVLWLVGVTNALNLLDNIDGLAGGIAAIAALFMTYFFAAAGQWSEAALTAAFAGAVTGFLFFNFRPASIFMGDCGSLFLGFFLGGSALLQPTHRSHSLVSLAPPVLILAIPIFDTTLVALSRKLHGRPISQGGRDHASHRLVALGLSERAATLTLYALAIASGLTGVAAFHFPASVALALLPLFLLAILFVSVYLGRVKVYHAVESVATAPPGRALLPTLADFTYKRRVFEVLNDFLLILVCYYCAFLLRFEGQLSEPYWSLFVTSLPIVCIAQLGVFLAMGLYRGLWSYTSIDDAARFFAAATLGVACSVVAVGIAFHGLVGFSRAMFVADFVLLLLGLTGSRVAFRLLRNWLLKLHGGNDRRVLIYGAGDGGEILLRQLRTDRSLGLRAVGFVDDDPTKQGKVIHGVRVVGTYDGLPGLLPELGVHEVVISSPELDESRLSGIVELCREHAVSCRRARLLLE
jgi:UDP-GlcNAc:undecaprenyl-phosphate GlcNAc-1-phosphate transferase